MLAAAGAAFAPRCHAAADPLEGAVLFKDVVAYSGFGEHRTATDADVRTSKWLMHGLRSAQFDAKLHPFRTQQFFLKKAQLQVGGKDLATFPLWWPAVTAEPVVRPLVPGSARAELAGKIALVKFPLIRAGVVAPNSQVQEILDPVIRAGAAAVVVVTESLVGELVTLNAEAGPAKWPIPILLVGQSAELALDRAASEGARTSVFIDGAYQQDAEAFEVVGRKNGGKGTVVVSTPSSGWFHCAGERGPGIALWLALARWTASRRTDMGYVFAASSGHELHGVGIEHFVHEIAPKAKDVTCWIHLGAGIATYDYVKTATGFEKRPTASAARRLYSSKEFEAAATEGFRALPDLKPIVTDRPGGEMIVLARAGYPFFGFAGGSALHHMPGDLPERITGPELLEPVARGLVKILTAIESRAGA